MEGESAFGYLNPVLELDLSECSRLEKRCEDASLWCDGAKAIVLLDV